jgi:hypothetical protein
MVHWSKIARVKSRSNINIYWHDNWSNHANFMSFADWIPNATDVEVGGSIWPTGVLLGRRPFFCVTVQLFCFHAAVFPVAVVFVSAATFQISFISTCFMTAHQPLLCHRTAPIAFVLFASTFLRLGFTPVFSSYFVLCHARLEVLFARNFLHGIRV